MVRIWNQPLRLEESTSALTALEDNYGHKWEKEDRTEGKQSSKSILDLIIEEAAAFSELGAYL